MSCIGLANICIGFAKELLRVCIGFARICSDSHRIGGVRLGGALGGWAYVKSSFAYVFHGGRARAQNVIFEGADLRCQSNGCT